MRFSKEFVSDVKQAVDVLSLVEESIDLKKAGKDHVGLCPFHPDKSPSLHIYASRNGKPGGYHCYACHAKGDAFDWATKYLNLSFYESVKYLAQRAGIALPLTQEDTKTHQYKSKLTSLLQRALSIYQHGLLKSPIQLLQLRESRGLTDETIQKWQLGLVSKGIRPYLKADETLMIDSGLVGTHETGRHFERLRMRITIPIYSPSGYLIGFAGRRLDSSDQYAASIPKYLNPPENLLFSKGSVLFGLNHASGDIRKHNRAVVVEGFFDVISLHQAGEPCAVAGMGTAFTPDQFKILTRYSKNISFCFDADEAGDRAAVLLIRTLLPLIEDGMEISFLRLPNNEDPDSYIRKFGIETWRGFCSEAMPMSEFILSEISHGLDPSNVENRVQILLKAKVMLKHVTAPLFREVLSQTISERYGVVLMEESNNGAA